MNYYPNALIPTLYFTPSSIAILTDYFQLWITTTLHSTFQYHRHLRNLSRASIIQQRLQLFNSFNGDAFYPLSVWPQEFKFIFWKKPISDKDTFKLFLFLIGNGCSPHLTSYWILTSQHWTTDKKAEKRARQLDFLLNNMDNKSHIWFYFDLHNEEWLYLNGQKRSTNNYQLTILNCLSQKYF